MSTLKWVWEPLRIGSTEVRNRLMATGHTQLYGKDEVITDRHVAYYCERARGGAGLLVLEQQAVHPAGMNYYAGCGAFHERAVPMYRKLADAVHAEGCKQFVQLFAGGSQGKGTQYVDHWNPLWSVSAMPSIIYNEMPLAMEREQIDAIVAGFVHSAANAQAGGLDGVEIHAAHSQLLGEFLSPCFNVRTDEYGGSVENRCRIVLEVARAVRERVGDDFTVGVRMSFDEYLGDHGITPEETEAQLEVLAAAGLFDFFNISAGGYHSMHVAVTPMGGMSEAFLAPYAKRAKQVIGDRGVVMVVGRILSLQTAEQILEDGASDMVALTRAQMADPFIVRKTAEGREREINRCAGINFCIERLIDNREVTCALNPVMGREESWGDGTLQSVNGGAKRIAVVGGGPAGMRCAGLAAMRGHTVTLFEAEDELGGNFNLLRKLPTREGWSIAVDNLVRLVENSGVEVRTGTRADVAALEGFDAVVCATGSTWQTSGFSMFRPDRPGVPGAEHAIDVKTAIHRALDDPTSLGRSVLIVDETAGYYPIGLAEILADAGVGVEIVTPQLFVGEKLLKSLDMPYVLPRVKAKGVELTAQQFVESIGERDAVLYDVWGGGSRTVQPDTVVLSLHKSADDALYRELKDRLPEVHRIGDCVAPRDPAVAIYEGEKLGREI